MTSVIPQERKRTTEMKYGTSYEFHNSYLCKDCGMTRLLKTSSDEIQAKKLVDMIARLHKKKCLKNNRLTNDEMELRKKQLYEEYELARKNDAHQIKVCIYEEV